MNEIGPKIEKRRTELGMSRAELGAGIGVSAQTVFNVERDPTYNLGTRLLRRLEEVLLVEFTIIMTKEKAMAERITMGNDELILHIRKHHSCEYENPYLGKRIWEWIEAHADGHQLPHRHDAPWGKDIEAVSAKNLPGSGVHFNFRLDALPGLFRFLAQLATEGPKG